MFTFSKNLRSLKVIKMKIKKLDDDCNYFNLILITLDGHMLKTFIRDFENLSTVMYPLYFIKDSPYME